jgi:trimeric autotransporter adhesin
LGSTSTITQADINRAINQRLLQILPALVAAISDPANAALTGTAKETAIVNAVSSSLLTTASMPTLVAINNQANTVANAGTPTGTVVAATPTAGFNLASLNFTNTTNWFVRTFGGDAAQNTPDSNNNTRFVDRKYRSNNGAIANWNFGNNPQDQANLHWTGNAWEACGLNFESLSSLRDAAGNNTSNYCNNYSNSKSNRVTFDVTGKTMTQVYDQVRSAGYTNLTVANSATALGAATFPTGSLLYYQATTPLTQAYAYTPGSGSEIFNYSAAVAVGGDSRTQAAGVGCNSAEFGLAPAIRTATLEGLVAAYKGAPCIYSPSSLVSNGVTYSSGEVQSEVWGGTSLSISTLGAVNVGGTPTSFYTGNTRIRLAFTGAGNNPVTYYACKERFTNGSIRNCSAIGTGTYTINTLGDARVMTLSNPPAQAAPFTFTRTFVERGGKVYFGYQDKFTVSNTARLNTTAANAMLTQLGMPTIDHATPMALTAASYQGTWNVRDPSVTGGGTTLNIAQSGAITCTETPTGLAQPCSLNITNAATGSISGTIDATSLIAGTLNFVTGIGTGTYSQPAPGGSFIATRR